MADTALLALAARLAPLAATALEAQASYDRTRGDDDFERLEVALTAGFDIVHEIETMPATTLAGLMAKARAISFCHIGDEVDAGFFSHDAHPTTDLRLAAGLLSDLLKLGVVADAGAAVPVAA